MNITLLQKTFFEKLEKIFFALFLLSIPIQTRITFYTPESFLTGSYNEYATFFIYLSDLLFIITLLAYCVNILTFRNFFTITIKCIHSFPHIVPIIFVLITLITYSFISIFWSEYKNHAFYQFIKFSELALLFLYIRKRFQWFGFNYIALLIFISGLFESIIGIAQYYLQRSLGLKLLMESVLSPEIPNVAKIVVDGERIMRAYGTFPHPNVFSGFLLLSIFCGIYQLFSHKLPKPYKIVSRETILYGFLIIGLFAQLSAFIFTFSRTAWIALIISILISIIIVTKSKLLQADTSYLESNNPNTQSNQTHKLFHVKQFIQTLGSVKKIIGLILIKTSAKHFIAITIILLVIIGINWHNIINRTNIGVNNFDESVDNRILYNNIAINIIKKNILVGTGSKTFTVVMQQYSNEQLEQWQFQPAHNIYILIASELGIIGLILFLLLLGLVIKKTWYNISSSIASRMATEINTPETTIDTNNTSKIVSRETISRQVFVNNTLLLQIGLLSVMSGFLFIGLFDHYLWTLQQGQLIFFLVLGLISAETNKVRIK